MKQLSKLDILIMFIVTTVSFSVGLFNTENTVVSIQLHDTYLVVEPWEVCVVIMALSSTLVFLIRCAVTRFKSVSANAGLIIGLLLIAWITAVIALIQSELAKGYLVDSVAQDHMVFLKNVSWAICGLALTFTLWLGARTVTLLRGKASQNH